MSHQGQLCEEYLDVYEGIQSEIVNTIRFDENSDFGTTYVGKSDKIRNDKLKAEESFPISEHRYTSGKLLDGTECQLLLDTGAQYSHSCPNPFICNVGHFTPYPNSHLRTQRIQVGNGSMC